jgi:L-ascorbate metabolism protein UlaG (beta-lactamase superfamily)
LNDLNKLTYISNAGVMLEVNKKKILIDSFCNPRTPIYKRITDEVKEHIILGVPPFNDIDLLLFTHHHTHHFDAESVDSFMERNEKAFVLATPQSMMMLNSVFFDSKESRFIKVEPEKYQTEDIHLNGIDIQAISMLHMGKEYEEVENFAYLINVGGKKILHVGDAKPAQENYMDLNLIREDIDLLIAPFPYISIGAGRQMIEKYIRPKNIVAMHLPYKELDSDGWIDAAKKCYEKVRDSFPRTVFLEEIGECIKI